MSAYKYTASFSKRFASNSIFAGKLYHTSLGFCTLKAARDWLAGVDRNTEAGNIDYRVEEMTITNVETFRVVTLRRLSLSTASRIPPHEMER